MKFFRARGTDARPGKEAEPRRRAEVIGFCVVCGDTAYEHALTHAFRLHGLKRYLGRGARTPLRPVPREEAEICIYAFAREEFEAADFSARQKRAIHTDRAKLKIFLELISPTGSGPAFLDTQRKNADIATLANATGGQVIPLMSKFLRWDTTRMLTRSGEIGTRGYLSIAGAVGKLVDRYFTRTRLRLAEASDAAQAATAPPCHDADAILESIRWDARMFPHPLGAPFTPESIADFLDGNISFSSYPGWGHVPFTLPIDWSMPGPNRSWCSYFLGLEFVGSVLAYLQADLEDRSHRHREPVAALLEQRGIATESLLNRAGGVIADFVRNNPPEATSAGRAWHEGTVCRRLRTLLMYLLCCKRLAKRGVHADAGSVVLAYRGVIDSIQLLRNDIVYIKGGNHGVRQDLFLIVASLLLSRGDDGKTYLKDGLARLTRYQLDLALSEDGVWRENSFGYHCMVMSMLVGLAVDLRTVGEPDFKPLLDAIERMGTFVEALIRVDGIGPLIGDTEPKHYINALMSARNALRGLRADDEAGSSDRIDAHRLVRNGDTYFFPKAGYFASHAARTMDHANSSVIFYANLSTTKHKHSDDLSLLFTHGAADLLVDGGTYNKEVGDKIRNAARFDPASHNTYRVNGKGYSLRGARGKPRAGLRQMWRGDGWAAASGFNSAYEDGTVTRLAIHLKAQHALIVVDQLASNDKRAISFEQFWHVAPQFALEPKTVAGLTFASPSHGKLLMAFDDGEATLAVEHGSEDNPIAWMMLASGETVPTPYVRRQRILREGTMASLFQWHEDHADLNIAVTEKDGGVHIDAAGNGFSCQFQAIGPTLECLANSPNR